MQKNHFLPASKTLLMGILNVTTDSFSGDGVVSLEGGIACGEQLIKDGADILDIGGESSRPGAEPISELQELERVIPIVRHFASKGNVLISVDTHKSNVAQKALEAGAHIINDITGLADDAMAPIVAGFGAKIIIMHMQGTPQTMQKNPYYKDVLLEIAEFFSQRIGKALAAGIKKENII